VALPAPVDCRRLKVGLEGLNLASAFVLQFVQSYRKKAVFMNFMTASLSTPLGLPTMAQDQEGEMQTGIGERWFGGK